MVANLASKLDWSLANPKWAATLNPLLANPLVQGQLINGIVLVPGVNVINHGLGRKLQGYQVVMNSVNQTYWDNQLTNQKPELTLLLNATSAATISLYVF